ncbi:MAG: FtsX-like permease family protein, partial [Desulfitobacterium hafniense]|nr:FtsX-like permease family protein [Desulfitobacterium hafniense]
LVTISESMEREMVQHFEGIGSKIIIKPQMDKLNFSYGPIVVASGVNYDVKELKATELEKIKEIEGFEGAISPKLLVPTEVNNKPVVLVGVDFEQELEIKRYWSISGEIPEGSKQVLVGSQVAKSLEVGIGDTISVENRDFIVTGLLEETASEEDGLIFAELPVVQESFNKQGLLTFVEINVSGNPSNAEIDQIINGISSKLPEVEAVAVKDAVESRKQLVDRFVSFSLVISLIVVVIGALIVGAAMMSSVNERTREIGIFRAIGYRKAHITKIILMEAGSLSLLGGIFGYIVGFLIAVQITPLVTGLELSTHWNPIIMVSTFFGAICIGLLASIYPVLKAAKLDPAEALRFI